MKLECKLCDTGLNLKRDNIISDIVRKGNYPHKHVYYTMLARLEETGLEQCSLFDEKFHRTYRYFRRKHKR